jgi:uncharacterized protein YnzC (UPF0291/DUF896 family)
MTKKITLDYDRVNELAMAITDEILNVFESKEDTDFDTNYIKIYLDDSKYSFDLQDTISDKLLDIFKIKEETNDTKS